MTWITQLVACKASTNDCRRIYEQQSSRKRSWFAEPDWLLGRAYLSLRGYRRGCLAIFGFEGFGEELAVRRARALALIRAGGGLAVGRSPGEAWREGRF